MEEQNREEILEIDPEQLQGLLEGSEMGDKLPPFEIEQEDYDEDEFKRGIKDSSHLAGYVTGLMNAGLSEVFILDLLLSKENIEYNLKANEIQKEMNIEIAKNQKLSLDKQEL